MTALSADIVAARAAFLRSVLPDLDLLASDMPESGFPLLAAEHRVELDRLVARYGA